MLALKPRHPYFFMLILILLTELLSFTAYFLPAWQIYLLAAALIAVFLLSLYSLEAGLLIAVTELVIGSKGHLFSAAIGSFPVSLRLVIWLALMLASLIFISRRGWKTSWQQFGQVFRFWPFLLALSFFILLAFIQGWSQSHMLAEIMADGNAWFYLTLIVPILLVYSRSSSEARQRLGQVFLTAVIWLSFKTLALLFIFSHNLVIMPDIYLWVRRSGIGEITAMGGGWQRIFIQSQVYAPIAFFLTLWPLVTQTRRSRWYLVARLTILSLLLSVIVVSMSRSFWLAFAVAALVAVVWNWWGQWARWVRVILYSGVAMLGALLLIFLVVKFPYPDPQAGLSADALAARLDFSGNEAALASRWALLPQLWQEIQEAPILGQGFGATVSYYSQDPRVLAQNPDGWYTTYAFEWAYLDTWLKLGLLGLLPYLGWLFYLLFNLMQAERGRLNSLYPALGAGLLFLLVVNIFTPYLNHPLGLSFVLFSSCFIRKNSL